MPFQIRQATILDLDTLAPLFDGYRQFYGQPADLARAHDFLAERVHQHESLILLARDEHGEGLGFTQLYPLFSSVRTVRTWLLNDLFVVPSARRQGVAAGVAGGHSLLRLPPRGPAHPLHHQRHRGVELQAAAGGACQGAFPQ